MCGVCYMPEHGVVSYEPSTRGANQAFLHTSFDSRVQIWPFCPVGFHGCCPELRQEPAQLRVLRNSPRAMPLFGLPIIVMIALYTSRKQGKLQRACAYGGHEIHVCRSGLFAPVGLHGCCPELRQESAQLRVLRKRNSSGKASSDAGPELAGRESCVAMESPQALMCPLEKGINKSSSDDRPGPGICDSKYVEDAKAARSVRVWDRVPMKNTRLGGLR